MTSKPADKTENVMKIKLTKSALNSFIVWSTSRYNNYLWFGTKKKNVDEVYEALKVGHRTVKKWNEEAKDFYFEHEPYFKIECSGGNGESWNGKRILEWKEF